MPTCGNDKLLFLHTPKTGGHWVVAAMEAGGVHVEREGHGHAQLHEVARRGRFTFAFVREPVDWYRSWWGWVNREPANLKQAETVEHVLLPYASLALPDFLEACLTNHPGYLAELFAAYVGPPEDPIDFIGHYENLQDDLCKALGLAGQDFDEQALRATPPVNVSRLIAS